MQNKRASSKAGILVILLLVPALVFLFLYNFGENEFDLPYKFPIGYVSQTGEWQDFIKSSGGEYRLEYFSNNEKKAFGDTVYLKAPFLSNNRETEAQIVYFKGTGHDLNIEYELERLSDKLKNIDNVELLYFGNKENMTKAWLSQLGFLEVYIGKQFDIKSNGVVFLIDNSGFFRGVYDPTLKSEFDRLITEYQILLNF